MKTALIIGAGPAGLMAAEVLSGAGIAVTVAEAKPSVGRKLLMAGKSGLNLTKNEDLATFQAAFRPADWLAPIVAAFPPTAVTNWAEGLGQAVFTGSSLRIFPKEMKASPLLRAWMGRLAQNGVQVNTRWRWVAWDQRFTFDTPEGRQNLTPDVCVLALGGASWARLGSDGAWAEILAGKGIALAPFQPANMGVLVKWSTHMARHFGAPVKGVTLRSGDHTHKGEFVISGRGLEGGGIYAVSRGLRDGAPLTVDLMPDWDAAKITARLAAQPAKQSLANRLRKALRLDPAKIALLQEFARPLPQGADLARLIKCLPMPHEGPRPIDEAISTAGGVAQAALTDGLMFKDHPGVYAVGEMLDWEAPTGGYLITGCLATGRWAAHDAVKRAATS